jgi:hypothetical protein
LEVQVQVPVAVFEFKVLFKGLVEWGVAVLEGLGVFAIQVPVGVFFWGVGLLVSVRV